MQNVSALYNQLLTSNNHWFETKLVIDGVGEFTEEQLFSVRTNLEMFSGSPEVGTAIAGEIDIEMLKPTVDIPRMVALRPYVRVAAEHTTWRRIGDYLVFDDGVSITDNILVFSQESGAYISDNVLVLPAGSETLVSEWLPQGVFFVDTREFTKNESGHDSLIIHGFDAMLKAEQLFESDTITGDSTDEEMVEEIAGIIGVEVDDRTYDIMGNEYIIPLPTAYTCREVLGYIAGMYVGSFIITDEGKLRLISILELPPETNYLSTEDLDAIVFGEDRILV